MLIEASRWALARLPRTFPGFQGKGLSKPSSREICLPGADADADEAEACITALPPPVGARFWELRLASAKGAVMPSRDGTGLQTVGPTDPVTCAGAGLWELRLASAKGAVMPSRDGTGLETAAEELGVVTVGVVTCAGA